MVGIVIGGAVQLYLTYTHATNLPGTHDAMGHFASDYFRWLAEGPLQKFLDGRATGDMSGQVTHMLFGAGLATFLMFMCHRSARWPIHPVALLFVGNWYAHRIWFSVLLGWALKVIMLTYGGSRGYRAARNVFLGFMIGEVASVVLWVAVAGIVAAFGYEYQVVRILPF